MKALLATLTLTSFAVLTVIAMSTSVYSETKPASADEAKLLRHVVAFQFKDTASEADVQRIIDAFRELPKKIPAIHSFEFGTNNSPEGLADGFTHCFLVTFKTEQDRDIYLPHPDHIAFVDILKPHLEKAFVIDYWTQK